MRVEAGSDLTFALLAGIRQHGSEEESTAGTTVTKKPDKNVYFVVLLLFLGGVGYLAYSGFSENSVYFLNVSEVLATPFDKLKAARPFGTVTEDGLSRSETGRDVKFRLEGQENKVITLRVEYTGAIPDTFKAGAEVIVEGGLRPDGSLQVKTLTIKYLSKYQKENRGWTPPCPESSAGLPPSAAGPV